MRRAAVLFAGGEALGTIALFTLVPVSQQKAARKYFPVSPCRSSSRQQPQTCLVELPWQFDPSLKLCPGFCAQGPFNMMIIIGSLGALAILLAVHSQVLTIIIITLIMGLNDFGTSLTAEAQGATVSSEHYARMNMLGNVCRRVGNMVRTHWWMDRIACVHMCVCPRRTILCARDDIPCSPPPQTTAVLGPIMFGVAYYLPFVVFGVTTVLWVCMMAGAFSIRGTQVAKMINKQNEAAGDAERAPEGLQLYARHATFVSAETRAVEASAASGEMA